MDSERPHAEGNPAPSAKDSTAEQLGAPALPSRQPCPFCFELVRNGARKCPHCQEYLDAELAAASKPLPPTSRMALASLVLALVSPVLFLIPAPFATLLGLGYLVAGDKRRTRGRGVAVGGVLLGLFWTAVLVGVLLTAYHGYKEGKFSSSPSEPLF